MGKRGKMSLLEGRWQFFGLFEREIYLEESLGLAKNSRLVLKVQLTSTTLVRNAYYLR